MLHYQKTGTGFPVVLLHGFCENNTCFNRQVLLLKDHFTLIVPDLPGSSSAIFDEPISMEMMADQVYRLLASLHINKCIMIGHSMGGYVALALAKKYAPLLLGFGLLHSTALADDAERKEKREQTKRVIETKGASFFANSFIPSLFHPTASQHLLKDLLAVTPQFTNKGLVAQVDSMKNRPDSSSFIKETTLPIFWGIGKYDELLPQDLLFKQALSGKMVYIAYLTNSAHMGHLEQEQALAQHLVSFCNGLTD
jgi:pimeloyl-ACP methyl ester carboxylesterase